MWSLNTSKTDLGFKNLLYCLIRGTAHHFVDSQAIAQPGLQEMGRKNREWHLLLFCRVLLDFFINFLRFVLRNWYHSVIICVKWVDNVNIKQAELICWCSFSCFAVNSSLMVDDSASLNLDNWNLCDWNTSNCSFLIKLFLFLSLRWEWWLLQAPTAVRMVSVEDSPLGLSSNTKRVNPTALTSSTWTRNLSMGRIWAAWWETYKENVKVNRIHTRSLTLSGITSCSNRPPRFFCYHVPSDLRLWFFPQTQNLLIDYLWIVTKSAWPDFWRIGKNVNCGTRHIANTISFCSVIENAMNSDAFRISIYLSRSK